MIETATLSTKGQLTLPIRARRALGLKAGDSITVSWGGPAGKVELSKPMTLNELSTWATSLIKPGTPPVASVDDYYQKHRPTPE